MTPSRATAAGVPARVLVSVWREAAETGRASCMLSVRDGVLIVSWANRPLCDLLGLDSSQLVGHSLRRLIDRDSDHDPNPGIPDGQGAGLPEPLGEACGGSQPAASPDRAATESLSGVPAQRGVPQPLIGWARLAHQFLLGGSGRGIGLVQVPNGNRQPAQVTVIPVSTALSAPPAAATLPAAGTVGELPPPPPPAAWLVAVEPVADRLANLESALTVAEHRFAALAGCAPVGIFVSEAGARLGYVNDRFVALTGRDAHALLGIGWLDAVHRDDRAAVYTAIQTVLGGTPVDLAVRWMCDGDTQRWIQLRLAPTTSAGRAAGFIGTAEDVTQRRSWEEHITYQAQHDALTGLVNRRRLLEVLHGLMSGRRHRDRDFAVLFLDLDGFKGVNDAYGHDAGDRALIEVAHRLQRVARETDVLARVAGDEFIVVLRHINADAEAEAAARRHLAVLAAPVLIGTSRVTLSASIGVAMPHGFATPEELLRAADQVMYEAKAAGPGEYRLVHVSSLGKGS